MRKQEYERKRKDYEENRKKNRKNPAEPRKRKKKNQQGPDGTSPEGSIMSSPTAPGPGGPLPGMEGSEGQTQSQAPVVQPKKRQRKNKSKSADSVGGEDKDSRVEGFLRHLHNMPVVALSEPEVGCFINVSPVHGSATLITGNSSHV